MAYASVTRTRRNVLALRDAGWRMLISPANPKPAVDFRYAIDNGAWSAHTQGLPWEPGPFEKMVALQGGGADWIVVPDVVAQRTASLKVTAEWLPKLAGIAPLLIAVQDGMVEEDVAPWLGPQVGLFVGGSTDWKLATVATWGRIANWRGCYLHIGRVNTARRIALAISVGAHSFDGTSVSKYVVTLPLLDAARRQLGLKGVTC